MGWAMLGRGDVEANIGRRGDGQQGSNKGCREMHRSGCLYDFVRNQHATEQLLAPLTFNDKLISKKSRHLSLTVGL